MTDWDIIQEIMKVRGLKKSTELAEMTGIHPSDLSRIKAGTKKITKAIALDLYQFASISPTFTYYDQGKPPVYDRPATAGNADLEELSREELLAIASEELKAARERDEFVLTEDEKRVIRTYRQAPLLARIFEVFQSAPLEEKDRMMGMVTKKSSRDRKS